MKNQSLLNKRIPTLFALLILIIGGVAATVFSENMHIFSGQAGSSEVPQNVRVANSTDTSFTVSYTTSAAVSGSISFGKTQALGTVVLDDRDQAASLPHLYTTHIMTITHLTPNTTYYFSITSGGGTYRNDAVPFTATTGSSLTSRSLLNQTLSGSVVSPEQKSGSNILVYAQPENAQPLVAVTDVHGAYHISLAGLRDATLEQMINLPATANIALLITDGIDTSHIKTTMQNSTLPTIVLSQDYDFTQSLLPTGTQSASISAGFPLFGIAGTSGTPAILIPAPNESFTDQQPEFAGTAQPNAGVNIVIPGQQIIQTTVTADANGQWSFRPDTPLSSGANTITIHTQDASGTLRTLTQSFTILPSGSQVTQNATPSATVMPTQSVPTATPTSAMTLTPTQPVPTPTGTGAPIATVTATLTPTATLTMTPMPTQSQPTPTAFIPSPTKPPLPSTGNASIFVIGVASIITTIVGIGLFFLTGGGI